MANALVYSGVNKNKNITFSLAICLAYAISDEINQLFVPGRGGEVKDDIIDSDGALVGILVYRRLGKES